MEKPWYHDALEYLRNESDWEFQLRLLQEEACARREEEAECARREEEEKERRMQEKADFVRELAFLEIEAYFLDRLSASSFPSSSRANPTLRISLLPFLISD